MKDPVAEKFGLVWPVHTTNLVQFLISARKVFDGDIDMFLVLAVIGDRTFAARKADPGQSYESWRLQKPPYVPTEDINIRSIADFSGIPRETVRRKLAALLKKGWVQRNEGGMLIATSKARDDLEPLTDAAMHYLREMFKLLKTIDQK